MAFLQDLFRPKHGPGGEMGESGSAEAGVPEASLTETKLPEEARNGPEIETPRQAEKAGGAQLVLLLDDVLSRVPTQSLQPGLHDPNRELHFEMEELLEGISRGRATIPLSRLALRYPETFQAPAEGGDDTPIFLPLQKLIQQIGRASRRPIEKPVPLPAQNPSASKADTDSGEEFTVPAAVKVELAPVVEPSKKIDLSPKLTPSPSAPTTGVPLPAAAFKFSPFPMESAPERIATEPPKIPIPAKPLETSKEKPAVEEGKASVDTPPLAGVTKVAPPAEIIAAPAAAQPVQEKNTAKKLETSPSLSASLAAPPDDGVPEPELASTEASASEKASLPAQSTLQQTPASTPLSAPVLSNPPPRTSEPTAPARKASATPAATQAAPAPVAPLPATPETGMRILAGRPHVRPPSIHGPAGVISHVEPQPAPPVPGFVFAPRPSVPLTDFHPEPMAPPATAPEVQIPPLFPIRRPSAEAPSTEEKLAPSTPVPAAPPIFATAENTRDPVSAPVHENVAPAAEAVEADEEPPSRESPPVDLPRRPASREPWEEEQPTPPEEHEERRIAPSPQAEDDEGRLLGSHFSLARVDQEPLQAIFMTEEFLDLPRVSQLSSSFPGVTGCLIVAGDALAQSGERPAGLDAAALCRLTRRLSATAAEFPSELPAVQTITLHAGQRALSIFARTHVAMCIVHSHRGFLPGVRERLGAVADTLARGLSEEVEGV